MEIIRYDLISHISFPFNFPFTVLCIFICIYIAYTRTQCFVSVYIFLWGCRLHVCRDHVFVSLLPTLVSSTKCLLAVISRPQLFFLITTISSVLSLILNPWQIGCVLYFPEAVFESILTAWPILSLQYPQLRSKCCSISHLFFFFF